MSRESIQEVISLASFMLASKLHPLTVSDSAPLHLMVAQPATEIRVLFVLCKISWKLGYGGL